MNRRSGTWRMRVLCLVVGAGLAAIAVGCGSSSDDVDPPAVTVGKVFVTTTDFSTGGYASVDVDALTGWVAPEGEQTADIVSSDNAVTAYGGRVYVINRSLGNVTVLDGADLTTAVTQFGTGEGSNPHAMAFASAAKAYVSLYGEAYVLVVDPADGSELGRVDLSAFADADDIPEASPMVIVGDKLFVAVQRLDRDNWFAPTGESYLVVIDTVTDEVVDVDPSSDEVDPIVLTGTNPQYLRYDAGRGKIVVSETGNWGVQDGGLETVDPDTYEAEGFFATETTLGGDVGDFVPAGADRVYAVVSDASYQNDVVVAENGVDGWTRTGALGLSGAYIPSLAATGFGHLLVPDRSTDAPGVRVYDLVTGAEITTKPIDTGLPPNRFALL